MTLNQVIKNTWNCSNRYLQILFNPEIGDFQCYEEVGFYVNFQSHLEGYYTICNTFKKLSKRDLADLTYEFLSENNLRKDIFLKKYSKWCL